MPDAGATIGRILDSLPIVEGVKAAVTDPRSMINDQGQFSITRFLSKEFRDEKTKERKLVDKAAEYEAAASAFNTANMFNDILTDIAANQHLTLEQKAAAARRSGAVARDLGYETDDRDFYANIAAMLAQRNEGRADAMAEYGLRPGIAGTLSVGDVATMGLTEQATGQAIRQLQAQQAADAVQAKLEHDQAMELVYANMERQRRVNWDKHVAKVAETAEEGRQTRQEALLKGEQDRKTARTKGRWSVREKEAKGSEDRKTGRAKHRHDMDRAEQEFKYGRRLEAQEIGGRIRVAKLQSESRLALEREKGAIQAEINRLEGARKKASDFRKGRIDTKLEQLKSNLRLAEEREKSVLRQQETNAMWDARTDFRKMEQLFRKGEADIAWVRKQTFAKGEHERQRTLKLDDFTANQQMALLNGAIIAAREEGKHRDAIALEQLKSENAHRLATHKADLDISKKRSEPIPLTPGILKQIDWSIQLSFGKMDPDTGEVALRREFLPALTVGQNYGARIAKQYGVVAGEMAGRMAMTDQLRNLGICGPLWVRNVDEDRSWWSGVPGDTFDMALMDLQKSATDALYLHKLGALNMVLNDGSTFDPTDPASLDQAVAESLDAAGIPVSVTPAGVGTTPEAWAEAGFTTEDWAKLQRVIETLAKKNAYGKGFGVK